MNHDVHALISVLTNTGIVLVCLCSIICFYLRTSILSGRRENVLTNTNRHGNQYIRENYLIQYNLRSNGNNNLNNENIETIIINN